jgi:hypothetical protein
MIKDWDLRERADIVVLAQECGEQLKAQPLIDYFEEKFKIYLEEKVKNEN